MYLAQQETVCGRLVWFSISGSVFHSNAHLKSKSNSALTGLWWRHIVHCVMLPSIPLSVRVKTLWHNPLVVHSVYFKSMGWALFDRDPACVNESSRHLTLEWSLVDFYPETPFLLSLKPWISLHLESVCICLQLNQSSPRHIIRGIMQLQFVSDWVTFNQSEDQIFLHILNLKSMSLYFEVVSDWISDLNQ